MYLVGNEAAMCTFCGAPGRLVAPLPVALCRDCALRSQIATDKDAPYPGRLLLTVEFEHQRYLAVVPPAEIEETLVRYREAIETIVNWLDN